MTIRGLGRRLYEGWLVIAAHFGEIQTLVIVGVVYVFVLGPLAEIAPDLRDPVTGLRVGQLLKRLLRDESR